MKNIWNIFRADWRRLTASVVAVVVLLGLCLVPCLNAWFNILSNWDPYGTASPSRISVAVASEDAGCEVLGLEVNIGALVLQGLESNDQMGWVFVDSRAEALDGVESGDYYAALIVPELMPAQKRRVLLRNHPIRVRAVQIAVRVDRFRLDPQPEIHAQRVHPVDQFLQTVRKLLRVDRPGAQPCPVGMARANPAVVHHEKLHAHPRRAFCQSQLRVRPHVELRRFP